jgi:hypothetical protein
VTTGAARLPVLGDPAPGPAPLPEELAGDTMVPAILAAWPSAREVFDRHGLRGCGGESGPAETLGFFARAHGVDFAELVSELRAAIARPDAVPARAAARPVDSIYRRFFLGGIAVALTAGATWGAYLLLTIARARDFGAVSLFAVNAHGQAQIYGWVGLFVMGFAYQAFPRFKGVELAYPRLALATFPLMIAAIAVRAVAEALHRAPFSALAFAAAAAQFTAVVAFAVIVAATLRGGAAKREVFDRYLLAAAAWFVASSALDLVHLARLLWAPSDAARLAEVATWQLPLRDLQIHGLALTMILGVSLRFLPGMLGTPAPDLGRAGRLFWPLQLAVLCEVTLFPAAMTSHNPWLFGGFFLATLLFALAAAASSLNLRAFARPLETPAGSPLEPAVRFVRAAHVWLWVSLAMLVAAPFWSRATGTRFSHAWYGATRHAITVGFISLMIVGVASKVAPLLSGGTPARRGALWAPFVLLNLGCALRVTQQVTTDVASWAFVPAGLSGVLEVTGLVLWGGWLVRAMRPARLEALAAPNLDPDSTVAAIIAGRPDRLQALIDLGFTPLANPVLRSTLARGLSLRGACTMKGIPLDAALRVLAAPELSTARTTNAAV